MAHTGLFVCGHRMHLKIEGPAITKVEHTLLAAAFKCMRRLPRQTDIGRRTHLLPRAIGSDIREGPLQPYIQFIAGVAMVGDDVSWRRSQQDLPAAFSEIAAQGCDLDSLWQPVQFQWRPSQHANVDNGLVRTEGIRTFG